MAGVRSPGGAAWLALPPLLACTQVSDRERFEPSTAPLEILATVPADGETEVGPWQPVAVCLSTRVDPRTINGTDVVVSSGQAEIDTALTTQLFAWSLPDGAPVPGQSDAPWCDGSVLSVAPQAALTAGARYRLQMSSNVRGWAGELIDTTQTGWLAATDDLPARFVVHFVAGEDRPGPDPQPPSPTLTDLFAAGAVFDPARGACSCHTDPEQLAARRLDLSNPANAFDALLGSGDPRETGFAMVVPRQPSESFLIQKLMRDADDAPLHGVLGDAMPPDEPLPYQDLIAIARWIESGALP